MGWGRYLLLGDIGQQMDLGDNRRAVDDLRAVNASQDQQIAALRAESQRLREFLYGLADLLEKKNVVTPAELDTMVTRKPETPDR